MTWKLNSIGLHDVKCPACQGCHIESFLMSVTPEYDPNKKLCWDCGYAWEQCMGKSRSPRPIT